MELNFNEIRELLALLNQTDLAEFTLKSSDFELILRKQSKESDRPVVVEPADTARFTPPPVAPVVPAAPPAPAIPSPPSPLATEKLVEITSPIVGTFYSAPAPDEPPFVNVGDRIRNGQTVCIIEAMKIMNEIEAEVSGEIVEILVKNGDSVEFGQALMRVNPG
ncbi:acetyl-CoA carboxylase biotin carboxyl carrier protein [Leptolyngbya sp. O-77]|uniref:acetyl-CoA carboxylase biotin carboxyl carrier protein n=1 Tax=Leptolyngbya sp. O-77 TaxID=1080068 RepID=UPI00074D3DFA|nr:acetyl-CoA carboxylase biotin carboxyl carrier protein [Leptolyngbya sp. O-77]BAU42617.1 Biotin carboxyl carrier protein of acetyl-CoA carboxylase [Leptolyngbya sp. O-77]